MYCNNEGKNFILLIPLLQYSFLRECLDMNVASDICVLLLFFHTFSAFRDKFYCLCTVAALFVYCSSTVHETHNYIIKKNIKNGSHGTIYIFKNYFTIIFSIFNFNKNKLYSNVPICSVAKNNFFFLAF